MCHLTGVAGVGMNGVAQALRGAGWEVSGSDRQADQGQEGAVIRKLRLAGVRLVPQDGSGVASQTQAVVVSTAIEADNPDILAAQRLGVPVRHRADMLAELVRDRETVAVAGTSGKTTVTAMMGWLLEQLGADPTVVNGGALVNWVDDARIGNVRIGRSRLCVIETDESDKSLLKFAPDWAIITNMSADHFGMAETERLFAEFRSRVKRETVAGWDPGMPWHNVHPSLSRDGSRFTYAGIEFELPMLGVHNVENALQAAVLCQRMGYDLSKVALALRAFRGVQRRLEKVGEVNGVTVIDEYAHNPAKIAAAWRAVSPYYRRVIGFWRPHGFKPLALMYQDLLATFRDLCTPADRLILMPVYYAGGTVTRQVDADALVQDLQGQGTPVDWAPTYAALRDRVLREACPGDVVLCMGARDPGISQFAADLLSDLRPR